MSALRHTHITPPPLNSRKWLLTLAAALLVAPVWAQTITAPGLVGQTACAGPGETDNPLTGTVSSITTSGVTINVNAYNNLYGALRAVVGDGGPTSFPIEYHIRNARTNAIVAAATAGGGTRSSSSPNLNSTGNLPRIGLSPNTPYVLTVETTASGFGVSRPLMRRCFMTGGTYTPTNESGQPGFVANTTRGCFSISPLTHQDVRNCLCGRSRIWNDDTQNTAARASLGCANR
ncbi:MAG: hypothetical protein OXE94_14250 [Aestuariivita sp.]|nr:hypothetical protein [Aestuariivita sp.]MCY4202332.1 hypothetical protein [Aestuariivita sp.]